MIQWPELLTAIGKYVIIGDWLCINVFVLEEHTHIVTELASVRHVWVF